VSDRPLIAITDVGYRYPGGVTALEGVSAEVRPGEVLGVAGANGAGKSTLVRLLNGLLHPTTGVVLVDGLDTRRHAVHDLARIVGIVFQDPRSGLCSRTVADELAFGPRNLGLPEPEVRARVEDVTGRFGLADSLPASPFSLPAPRRRLVALASVLAMRTRVLVLDEPTTGQDEPTRVMVRGLVRSLSQEGVTVICVSHDMALLASTATRVLVLAGGHPVTCAPPRDVFADEASLRVAGLVAPQVTRLAAGLPALAGGPAILTVPELVRALRGDAAGAPSGAAAAGGSSRGIAP
jgi:energy-coupling factor transporter ATP-binding protein EcfA2